MTTNGEDKRAIGLLRKCDVLSDIPVESLAVLAPNIKAGNCRARVRVIYLPGDRAQGVHFLTSGRIKISKVTRDGKELTLSPTAPRATSSASRACSEGPARGDGRGDGRFGDGRGRPRAARSSCSRPMASPPTSSRARSSRAARTSRRASSSSIFKDVGSKLAELLLQPSPEDEHGIADERGLIVGLKIAHQEMANLHRLHARDGVAHPVAVQAQGPDPDRGPARSSSRIPRASRPSPDPSPLRSPRHASRVFRRRISSLVTSTSLADLPIALLLIGGSPWRRQDFRTWGSALVVVAPSLLVGVRQRCRGWLRPAAPDLRAPGVARPLATIATPVERPARPETRRPASRSASSSSSRRTAAARDPNAASGVFVSACEKGHAEGVPRAPGACGPRASAARSISRPPLRRAGRRATAGSSRRARSSRSTRSSRPASAAIPGSRTRWPSSPRPRRGKARARTRTA